LSGFSCNRALKVVSRFGCCLGSTHISRAQDGLDHQVLCRLLPDQLGSYLPRRRDAMTAPPRRRDLGPRPIIVSKYNFHRGIQFYLSDSPTYDNMVSVSPSSSTMAPPGGSSLGKELVPTADDITVRLDRLEELVHTVTSDLRDVK
jgi:hypothetical protein